MPFGTYTPPLHANHYTKKNVQLFFFFFFHFRCILLQISHKKCFFISISILGRSGVKAPSSSIFYSNKMVSQINSSRLFVSLRVSIR